MNSIVATNLSKSFKNFAALKSMTFTVPEGCIVGLIGRNGAGKTTLMKTVAGFLRPTSGELKVFGQSPFDNITVSSDIFYLDDDRYPDSLRVLDIVELSRLYYKNFNMQMSLKLLDYFGIDLGAKFKKLSKGTKTLLSIVLAICSRSPLTLLDEPTLGLDASHRKEFISLLLKDYSDFPRTIIVSSHLISELEGIMEQVILIDKGQVVFQKAIDEVQNFGLYLTGSKRALDDLKLKEILVRSEMGDSLTVGIKNYLTDQEKQKIAALGITISPMNVQDVCVNMTQSRNGGVLDAIQ